MHRQTARRGRTPAAWRTPAHSPTHLSTAEQRAALAAVKSEIAQYKSFLRTLKQVQRDLEDRLSLVVYPVLTIPNEIISRIFVACLPVHGRVRPSSSTAPLLLTQICGHWREIALATCELWSSIDVQLYPGSFHKEGPRHLAENWFSRAKGYPLSITLRSSGFHIPLGTVPSIHPFAAQIRRLELSIPNIKHSQLQPLPLLPRLEVLGSSYLDADTMQHVITHAPYLRHLHLSLSQLELPLLASLQFLTSLDIDSLISVETFLDVLATLPRLLHLGCDLKEVPRAENPTRTAFPHLSSLNMQRTADVNALDWVSFPHLQHLEISMIEAPDWEVVLPFLTRSCCPLEYLGICLDDRDEDGATQVLQAASSVKTLVIEANDDLNSLLAAFRSKPSLLPQLEHLTISTQCLDSSDSAEIEYEKVIEISECRRESDIAVKLKSFLLKIYVDDMKDPPRHSFPGSFEALALKRLIAGGLELAICRYDVSVSRAWPADSSLASVDPCEDSP